MAGGAVTGPGGERELEAAFRRFEELPARDAFDEKRAIVHEILDAVARHAARGRPGEHAALDGPATRLRLQSPEAPGHDEVVLALIDAARAHLKDGHDHGGTPPDRGPTAVTAPAGAGPAAPGDRVDETSDESFPASDPPPWASDPDTAR
jgi:hypothetical protein